MWRLNKILENDNLSLIKRAKEGDKGAESKLVSLNIGLVWSVARKFNNRGYDLEDIFQIGCIGILKAIKNFDESFNVKFSTYAVPLIMGEIKRFLRDDGIIKVSRHLKEIAQRASVVKEILEKELGREAKISEIAEKLEVTKEELAVAMEANIAPESLYKQINDNDKSPGFLIDKVVNKKNNEEEIVDKISLNQAICSLEEREKKIIVLRYYRGKTQSEIAKMIGISQVQVSRLEKKILYKMKKMIG
ncbi:MAG: RNA polymerase sporulation sigma factor SigF [Ruminococcaceae bacterium]|nr:RNA polymerase sporulation sigma factor SigF [Oscillospiraceae bacterium]